MQTRREIVERCTDSREASLLVDLRGQIAPLREYPVPSVGGNIAKRAIDRTGFCAARTSGSTTGRPPGLFGDPAAGCSEQARPPGRRITAKDIARASPLLVESACSLNRPARTGGLSAHNQHHTRAARFESAFGSSAQGADSRGVAVETASPFSRYGTGEFRGTAEERLDTAATILRGKAAIGLDELERGDREQAGPFALLKPNRTSGRGGHRVDQSSAWHLTEPGPHVPPPKMTGPRMDVTGGRPGNAWPPVPAAWYRERFRRTRLRPSLAFIPSLRRPSQPHASPS